ncbi:acyltransferase family protein [Ktedonosporobacter rubrisoli]|nr:acyltransferase family protein [Ktedonosporobacter rubrisoli]
MSSHVERTPLHGELAAPQALNAEFPAPKRTRVFFVDNLRVSLTILVIVHHLAITYGALGAWYFQDPNKDMLATVVLSILVAIDQAFFMGFFFLLSGYFTPGSYDRKGGRTFLWERSLRLGIPLLVYDLVFDPLVLFMAGGVHQSYWSFYGAFLLQGKMIGTGPSWFILALLFFAVLYALGRWFTRQQTSQLKTEGHPPTFSSTLLFVLALTVVTFVVRIWWPLGSYAIFGFQLAEFAQYISLFAIGLVAYRHNWFLYLPDALGRVWLRIAIGAMLLFPLMILALGVVGHADLFEGGWAWQALLYALWESVVCVGLCIGLLVLFRRHLNAQGRLRKALSEAAYTVYLIHPLIIVPLAYAARSIALYPLLKFALVVLIAVPLCFFAGYVLRKIPFMHKIL